jgi:hypothetical protein
MRSQIAQRFDNCWYIVSDGALFDNQCTKCGTLLGNPSCVGIKRITAQDLVSDRN